MGKGALGFIETYGFIGAVEAADACLKAANVEMVCCELVKGGLVTIIIQGDVGAVKAAIEAGSTAASKLGRVVSVHVIARPDEELKKIIRKEQPLVEKKIEEAAVPAVPQVSEIEIHEDQTVEEINNTKISCTVQFKGKSIELNNKKALSELKVVELRRIGRQLEGLSIDRSQIKFANKNELIDALIKYCQKEGK